MIKNYLKVALRNLTRYKAFSFINILGLTIGITGCLLIGLFVWDEMQFDRFVKDSDNIYRLYTKTTRHTGETSSANTPPMAAPAISENPEVVQTMRIFMWDGKALIETDNKSTYQDKGIIADSTFFQMFPLTLSKGNPTTALNAPTSIVLTSETAQKYFGADDPLGKTVKIDKKDFSVTGVLAPISKHFHLDIGYILPMSAAEIAPERMLKWTWGQFFTYIKVKEGTNVKQLESKFQQVFAKATHEETLEAGYSSVPYLQGLEDIHLNSAEFSHDNAIRGNATHVKGLTIIAIFVLLIACFNFINLATARSLRRAKEIGVRKVIGADRRQLIFQFTGETILVSIIAVIVAVIATWLILPSLNSFTGKSISFNPITNPLLGLLILSVALLIGILSGIYPAFFMSGFQPIKVLKGLKPNSGSGSAGALRQGLVIVQFGLSALLIVCAYIVYSQMNYLHEKDLGFNKEQILYFDARGGVNEKPEILKEEIKKLGGVVSVTKGYGLPGDQLATDGIIVPGDEGNKEHTAIQLIVDHDYIKTMGAHIIAGRDFSRQYATDVEEAFIINETAVKELGFGTPQTAIGKRLDWQKWVPDSINPIKKGKVIGVVKDFHVKSLHEKLATTILQIYPPVLAKFAVKVKTADLNNTIQGINKAWTSLAPDYPFDYKFLDENFAAMYKSEDKLSTLLWIFTFMAIFVGCMGLFGLAAFSAEQRVKEIGIRKVLGASAMNIVSMLSKAFLKPVVIASLIAFPIAWWAMHAWLNNFVYRVGISWWVFAVAAGAAIVIALISISFQAIKAAVANPVKALRSE